jgi:SAM-dependent methyltransferase
MFRPGGEGDDAGGLDSPVDAVDRPACGPAASPSTSRCRARAKLRRVVRALFPTSMTATHYDDAFYAEHVSGSLQSARTYLAHLFALWRPGSVIDLGCGRGAWLAACGELGVARLAGLDGDWVSQDRLLDPNIVLRHVNLREEIAAHERYDLAMSLEVAEHLPPASSDAFVRSLVAHADAILFGAAYLGQPGRDHINTQPHSFWVDKFLAQGYLLFDFFRPRFWSDGAVEPWYRQNTFLYVRPGHPLHSALLGAGYAPQPDARFVDCIHPWLYAGMVEQVQALQRRLMQVQRSAGPAPQAGRNAPCPCGSGKKYKHCHGR